MGNDWSGEDGHFYEESQSGSAQLSLKGPPASTERRVDEEAAEAWSHMGEADISKGRLEWIVEGAMVAAKAVRGRTEGITQISNPAHPLDK